MRLTRIKLWWKEDGDDVALIITSLIYKDHVANNGPIEWILTSLRLKGIKRKQLKEWWLGYMILLLKWNKKKQNKNNKNHKKLKKLNPKSNHNKHNTKTTIKNHKINSKKSPVRNLSLNSVPKHSNLSKIYVNNLASQSYHC